MTTEIQTQSQYSIFDLHDQNQIIKASEEVKQALVYQTKQGKREITYAGLKHLILQMSNNGHSLEVIGSKVELQKDDPSDRTTWIWRANVKVKNQKTGYESEGFSECPYFEQFGDNKGNYDPFGRTKAVSKSERNAWRKQIPELQIIALLKNVSGEEVQIVDSPTTTNQTAYCSCIQPKPKFEKDANGNHICYGCKKPVEPTKAQTLLKK